MKKTLYLFFLLISLFSYAQKEANRFVESEHENSSFSSGKPVTDESKDPEVVAKGPGDPPGPTPIDDYIPLLVIAAVGIIIYQTQQKKNAIQKK